MMLENRIEEILKQFGREKRGHYDLQNISRALEAVGNPNRSVYSLIIGGTNGKGSCSLFISAGLREAGFTVDTYLSPHLCSPRERFLRGLLPMQAEELVGLMESALPVAQKFNLSYFEFLTLIAFMRADRDKVDFLVLEVGLGGRLDATNLCDPLASVISNIGLDHQDFLGSDVSSILKEKLAIVRPEGLLFSGVEDEALVQQIEQHCLDIDAIPYYARELRSTVVASGYWGQKVQINGFDFELTCPSATTLQNAKTSLLLLRILFPKFDISVFQKAFSRVLLPARFETVQESPRVILSGDHNPQALDSLLATLRTQPRTGKLLTLAAFSPDKDFQSMIPRLKEISDRFVLGFIPGYETAMPESYATWNPDIRHPKQIIESLLAEASKDDIVLVTGSLYLVGAVRSMWSNEVRFLSESSI